MTETKNISSQTVTNEEVFKFSLEINEENEILSATQISYHCSECGAEYTGSLEEVASCAEHPTAIIDSVSSTVALVETPTRIGDDENTDVVFFTPESRTSGGQFGLQITDADGNLKAICDLDGEKLSSVAAWIITDRVPAPVAEYARLICS